MNVPTESPAGDAPATPPHPGSAPPIDPARTADDASGGGSYLWPVPGCVRFLGCFLVILLAVFALTRTGLIWRNWTEGLSTNPTAWQLVHAYIVGLRFDLAIACYFAAPIMLACYLPWTGPWSGRRARHVFLWGLTLVLGVAIFSLIAEWEFFREFQSRYNQLAIRYFTHPGTVGGMVWHTYPVVRYVLLWLAIMVVVHLALRLALRLSFPPEPAPVPKGGPALRRLVVREVAGAFVVVAAVIFGARGGFQAEPLRWGDAFRGPNDFANLVSLNGLYSLSAAARDSVFRDREASPWRGKIPLAEARSIVRTMLVAPGEKLLDPERRTVLRSGDPGSSIRLRGEGGVPVNVVVVMMESFSGRFSGSCGAPRSFTPHFDRLASEGVLFSRCLSAGSHTHQGIFATQLGFPNLPGFETLMESSISNQRFLSLPAIFKNRGYQTMFLYNGDLAWDNMKGFFNLQGIEKFLGAPEMRAEAEFSDDVWGVSDGDVFARANREFEAASKTGKPFYATVLTLSNHAPFQVPPYPGGGVPTDMGELGPRLNAIGYADHAVGKFIDDARKLSYFKNTLFVFVGDHGFHVPPVLTEVHLLYHHVPLLFLSPLLPPEARGKVDARVATQMNVLPSILGLLGLEDAEQAAWARSLFNDNFPDENFAVFKMSGGGRAVAMAQGDKLLVLGSSFGGPLLLTYDIGTDPRITPLTDPALGARMERDLRAYLQSALDDLTHKAAGPVPPVR